MSELDRVAAAFERMPDLTSVRRVKPDGLISGNSWLVYLDGSWLADHAGMGTTIDEAYADAKRRLSEIGKAA